jgi:hypothetical protein
VHSQPRSSNQHQRRRACVLGAREVNLEVHSLPGCDTRTAEGVYILAPAGFFGGVLARVAPSSVLFGISFQKVIANLVRYMQVLTLSSTQACTYRVRRFRVIGGHAAGV